MKNSTSSEYQKKHEKVGIIGLGYVGLPLAIRFSEVGFKVIGFDIIFPEKDRLSNLNPDERDNDTIFSKSIEEVKNVVLPLSLSTSNPSLVLPDTRSNINTIGLNNYDLFKTENSFIKSQKKLSIILKDEIVFFINNL